MLKRFGVRHLFLFVLFALPVLSFIAPEVTHADQQSIVQGKRMKRGQKRRFRKTFDSFCMHTNLDAFDALDRLYAKIGDLEAAFSDIIDINGRVGVDPDQCIADQGIDIDLPGFPDISECFDFDFDFSGCNFSFDPGDMQDALACAQGAFGNFDFGVDFDYGRFTECVTFDPPSLDEILGLLGDIDALLRTSLEDLIKFSTSFDPRLTGDLRDLFAFCGKKVPLP